MNKLVVIQYIYGRSLRHELCLPAQTHGIVGSNPSPEMDVYVSFFFILLPCV
jgi:hypothetical protein